MELRRTADDAAATCFRVRIAKHFPGCAAAHQPKIRQPTGVQFLTDVSNTTDVAWGGITAILGAIPSW